MYIDSIERKSNTNECRCQSCNRNILYFLHCDSLPLGILTALSMILFKTESSGVSGMKFDYRHPVLMISQWFTRFNHFLPRSNQLAIYNELFKELKSLMRISSFMRTMKLFLVYAKTVCNSDYIFARRYHQNGIWRLNTISVSFLKRRLGHSTESMLQYYKRTSFKQVLL
jgi:hypothetical protein